MKKWRTPFLIVLSFLSVFLLAAVEIQNAAQGRKARFSAITGGQTGTGAQMIALEWSDKPTYIVSVTGQANTVGAHAIALEAGASTFIRIAKLCITQPGIQTTAGLRILLLERTTAAGTAGVITAETANATTAALAREDSGDAAFSGIARAKPTTLGTQGATLLAFPIFVPAALAAFTPICMDWSSDVEKAPKSLNGVANGIALRDPGAAGGANFAAFMVFTEEAF